MSQAKELFINSVRQVRVQANSVIPTVVLYKDKKSWVGFDALENSDQTSELREDFKIRAISRSISLQLDALSIRGLLLEE